ncbi:alpha/beta hydrolase [Actinoplanes sp. NPDC051411]|uniref:alpha/beta hydrolase n=1 Tax=Actinoplanes sp. NPDC051411 TaxID=3155522 RepID=UPI00342CCD2A
MRLLASTVALAMSVAGPAPGATNRLDWHDCGAGYAAECATLTLPVDWSHPDGPTFGLAVARHRATDPAHRAGTLIYGPGGPGDSGVDRVVTGIDRFSPDLRRHFDIVSFDPRGVGDSAPIVCPPDIGADAPPPVLSSQADFDRTVAYNRELWSACTSAVFDHADTASTVRDLDALRAALGERTVTFQGTSYGTLLGEQYAERYPDRVRAIVLESVVDHRPTSTSRFLVEQSWAQQDSFDAFAAATPGQDVRADYATAFAEAEAGRLNISAFELSALELGLLKGPNYTRFAAYLAAPGTIPVPPPLVVVPPVFCNDWSLPVRNFQDYAAILRAAGKVAPDLHYGAQVMALTMCLGWPTVANPQHTLNVHTRTPLLLINSRHDPATGINWATSVQRQLGRNGVFVVYQGAGHGAYSLSDCIKQITDRYLISLTVPRRGTTC